MRRRHFLVGATALTVASGLVGCGGQSTREKVDAVVIGAGLSGLHAARLLADAGMKVVVLEGRDRIGGRVLSLDDVNASPEAGANTMFQAYGRTLNAARELDLELVDAHLRRGDGGKVYMIGGETIRDADEWARSPANPFPEARRSMLPDALPMGAIAKLRAAAPGKLWCDPANADFDIAMSAFLGQQGYGPEQIALAYDTNPSQGVTAETTSLLNWFFANAFFSEQLEIGEEEYAIKGGNSRLPEAMVRNLAAEIRLSSPVASVAQDDTGVTVTYAGGQEIRADHAICTAPFGAMRNMAFDPPLPDLHARAVAEVPQNRITQVHMEFSEPFWETDELAPFMWTDTLAGIVIPSRGGESNDEITSLTAWARGSSAGELDKLSEAEARQLVVSEIERIRPAAKGKLTAAGFKSWQTDPFSAGDWVGWAPGQATTLPQAARKPHGRVRFAGEHTSLAARGMEAAFESGERAALEVLSPA